MTYKEALEAFKDTPRYVKFVKDMRKAGFEVRSYEPRGMRSECPGVNCEPSQLQDIIRATKQHISTDSMGKGIIAYVR